MRVIAGQFRGTRLFSPKDRSIRPTTDRVREFIFSCIQQDIQRAYFLDLFCGTGAVGIEAQSRGAEKVVFVDSSRPSIQILEKNLQKLNIEGEICQRPAELFLRSASESRHFDIIFCDPPYRFRHFKRTLCAIQENKVLKPNGLIIYESHARVTPPELDAFAIERRKKLGETLITFYRIGHDKNSDISRNI